MAFKHYDVVRAASPSDLAEKLTHKLKEGWQPYGGPVAITPYTLMQAVAIEGDPQVGPSSEPDWFYVVVLAGQSNGRPTVKGFRYRILTMLRIRALNSWRAAAR